MAPSVWGSLVGWSGLTLLFIVPYVRRDGDSLAWLGSSTGRGRIPSCTDRTQGWDKPPIKLRYTMKQDHYTAGCGGLVGSIEPRLGISKERILLAAGRSIKYRDSNSV